MQCTPVILRSVPRRAVIPACLSVLLFVGGLWLAVPAKALSPDLISKAELLMALVESRVAQVPNIANPGTFPDVPKGHKYEKYMIIAEKYGIIGADAKSKNLFPDRPVSRAEFLKMTTYTFGFPANLPYLYKDILPGDWFAEYAGVAEKYGFFKSDLDTTRLRPGKLVTRQEAVQAIRLAVRLTRDEQRKAQEQGIARDQATNKLDLYLVTSSTKEKTIVTEGDPLVSKPKTISADNKESKKLRKQVLDYVNAERAKKNLPALTANAVLDRSAQDYAESIANLGFFSHVSPSGQTLRERILATGYVDIAKLSDCNCLLGFAFGENLARGQKTPKDVVNAWMKSQGHRENILNAIYNELGVGIYAGVWVQHFGGILTPEGK